MAQPVSAGHPSAATGEPAAGPPHAPVTRALCLGIAWLGLLPYLGWQVPWRELIAPGRRSLAELVAMGALLPGERALEEPWRLLSCIFLHGWLPHLAMNLLVLALVGRILEPCVGSLRFVAVFLLGGLAGSASSAAFGAAPSVGVSGANLGTASALLAWLCCAGSRVPRGVRGLLAPALLLLVVLSIGAGFVLPARAGLGVDNAAHIGGAAAGWILGAWAARARGSKRSRRAGAILSFCTLAAGLAYPAAAALDVAFASLEGGARTPRLIDEELRLALELPRGWRPVEAEPDPTGSDRKATEWRGGPRTRLRVVRVVEPGSSLAVQLLGIERDLDASVARGEIASHRLRFQHDLFVEGPGGVLMAYDVVLSPGERFWERSQERVYFFRVVETGRGWLHLFLDGAPDPAAIERAIGILRSLDTRP